MEESLPVTPRSILHTSVRSLLNKWDGYQIALINNLGGIETNEKDKWLCNEITKLLIENSNIEVDDFVDWLTEIFDETFDLILEDDSVKPAAHSLLETVESIREQFKISK